MPKFRLTYSIVLDFDDATAAYDFARATDINNELKATLNGIGHKREVKPPQPLHVLIEAVDEDGAQKMFHFICPECGSQHDRGWFPPGAVDSFRCLRCGYVGPSAKEDSDDA
jgi:uncharacterized protein CbrC (UPF0167 family)